VRFPARQSGIVVSTSRSTLYTRWLSEVERVILNALTNTRGFAAGHLCLRRINWHRLEDKPIHLYPVVFRFGQRLPSNSQRRQNTPANFAEANAVTIALRPAGDR
jgi:hypothetical protein